MSQPQSGGGVLQVTYATFDQLHSECERARTALNQAIVDMNADVDRQLAENWQGEGRASYLAAQHKWNTHATDLYNVLTSVEHALDGCRQTFAGMENQVVAMF